MLVKVNKEKNSDASFIKVSIFSTDLAQRSCGTRKNSFVQSD